MFQPCIQDISKRTHERTPTWLFNSSSNLPRGPLVRSHSIFDGLHVRLPNWMTLAWCPGRARSLLKLAQQRGLRATVITMCVASNAAVREEWPVALDMLSAMRWSFVGKFLHPPKKGTVDGSEIPKTPPGMYKTLEIMGYLLYINWWRMSSINSRLVGGGGGTDLRLHRIKTCRICKWGKGPPPKFEVSKRTWRKYYIMNKLIYSSYGQFVVHLILCWNSWMFLQHWKRLLLHACFCVGNIQKLLRILSNPSLQPAVEHCYPKESGCFWGVCRDYRLYFHCAIYFWKSPNHYCTVKAWDPACLRDLASWPARLLININPWFVDQIINSTISIYITRISKRIVIKNMFIYKMCLWEIIDV